MIINKTTEKRPVLSTRLGYDQLSPLKIISIIIWLKALMMFVDLQLWFNLLYFIFYLIFFFFFSNLSTSVFHFSRTWWGCPSSACLLVLPSGLGNDHFRADLVEPFPQVWSLQVHAGLLPGAGNRRRAHGCGLRALQQRVLALCCTGKRRD